MKLFTNIVLQLASAASILGLFVTLLPLQGDRPWWYWSLLFLMIGVSIYLIRNEIVIHRKYSPKTYTDQSKINEYMRAWVSQGGRVVIFSRDMSWAREDATHNLLLKKARNNELTICIEQRISATDELESAGAVIMTYGELGRVPRSRFTIVDFEREGARVAVGAKINGKHVIQEFQSGEHPLFGVAEDLVKMLSAYNAQRHDTTSPS